MIFKKKKDILKQQQEKLELYAGWAKSAVSTIHSSLSSLESVVSCIDATVEQVEMYEKELAETKSGLIAEKTRNQKVIQNFRALLNLEQ